MLVGPGLIGNHGNCLMNLTGRSNDCRIRNGKIQLLYILYFCLDVCGVKFKKARCHDSSVEIGQKIEKGVANSGRMGL